MTPAERATEVVSYLGPGRIGAREIGRIHLDVLDHINAAVAEERGRIYEKICDHCRLVLDQN